MVLSLWILTKIVDDDDDNEWKQDVQLKYLPWVRAKDLPSKIWAIWADPPELYHTLPGLYKYTYFLSETISYYTRTISYNTSIYIFGPVRTISHYTIIHLKVLSGLYHILHHDFIMLYNYTFLSSSQKSEQSYFYSGLSYSIDTVCVYTQMYECTIRNIITAMWYQWLYVSPHQCSTIVRIIITKIDYCTNKDYRRTSQWRFMCFVGGAPPFRPLTAFLSFHSCYWYYLPSSSRWWHKSWHEL